MKQEEILANARLYNQQRQLVERELELFKIFQRGHMLGIYLKAPHVFP